MAGSAVPFQALTPGNPGRVGEDSARPRAALRFRRSQDHKRVILAEPDCPNRRVSDRVTMVPAGSKPGTDENKTGKETDHGIRLRGRLPARRTRVVQAQGGGGEEVRQPSRQFPQKRAGAARRGEAIRGGVPRHEPNNDRGQAGNDRNRKSVAFDAKGELVAAPAGRKTVSAEPTVAPAADAATDPETTGSDVQAADDETAPQEAAAEPDTSDDGRPAWASGNY